MDEGLTAAEGAVLLRTRLIGVWRCTDGLDEGLTQLGFPDTGEALGVADVTGAELGMALGLDEQMDVSPCARAIMDSLCMTDGPMLL